MARVVWIVLFIAFILSSWLIYAYCDRSESPIPPSAQVLAGWDVYQAKNCQACHQIYGLGGYLGPDLTNTAGDKGPEYMKAFISKGTGKMPDFHLSDTEVNNLISFLSWVNKSGKSNVPANAVKWNGSFDIKN